MVEIRECNSDTLCAEIVLGASHIGCALFSYRRISFED